MVTLPLAGIIAALKQVEAGRTANDVARECGVYKHTIYAWKAKVGGMAEYRSRALPTGDAVDAVSVLVFNLTNDGKPN